MDMPEITMEVVSHPAEGFDPDAWVEEEVTRLTKIHGGDPANPAHRKPWETQVANIMANTVFNPYSQLEAGQDKIFVMESMLTEDWEAKKVKEIIVGAKRFCDEEHH